MIYAFRLIHNIHNQKQGNSFKTPLFFYLFRFFLLELLLLLLLLVLIEVTGLLFCSCFLRRKFLTFSCCFFLPYWILLYRTFCFFVIIIFASSLPSFSSISLTGRFLPIED